MYGLHFVMNPGMSKLVSPLGLEEWVMRESWSVPQLSGWCLPDSAALRDLDLSDDYAVADDVLGQALALNQRH